MIIYSLIKSIKNIISNPLVLIPALIVGLFSFVITNLTAPAIEQPLIDLIIYNTEATEINLINLFIIQYPLESIIVLAGAMATLFINSVCLLILANYINKQNLVDAVDKGVKEFGKAISLTILLILTGFLGAIIYSVFSNLFDFLAVTIGITSLFPVFAWIFMIITITIMAILITKIAFVIPALTEAKPKKALAMSWEFTNNKFWSAFILIIILTIISLLVINIFETIGLLLDIESIFSYTADVIVLTFTGLTLANYYFKQ